MDQYIGKLLDNRYEILEVIGTGGMAVVYKARCHRLNRLVAIKILREDLAQDAEFRRRFHDESQAVAMLSHPNIMAVYDVSRSSEVEYIVMELLDGITLKQYMQKKGAPLNWREALHFITQIMKALSHAHSRGIIHRDIKPQNIMVLRDGSVKVADFGIARLSSATQNTLTQEALGSVHYISPEQARGSRIDARSDIYSAGVVLYEMLSGRLPYEGDSPVSVAIQHINSIPLAPRELNPEIPEALESITLKAMASNVEQRYINAEAMLADLEEFRKNPSINFDFTPADLINTGANDEPTQIIDTGRRKVVQKSSAPAAQRGREPDYYDDDEESDMPNRKRKRGRDSGSGSAILAVGVILIFVVGIGLFLWLTFFSDLLNPTTQELVVPDLSGKTVAEIMEDDTFTKNFEVKEAPATLPSDTVPLGAVLSQSPEAGDKVSKAGDTPITITITLSAGESELTVPNMANMEYRQAQLELEKLGLIVAAPEFAVSNEGVTKDFVISTDPAAGAPIAAGSQIKLIVSLGPDVKKVTVPDFLTMSLEAAKEQIKSAGLTLGGATPVKSDKPKDTIVNQSFAYGTTVAEGTTIYFQVSAGPEEGVEVSPSPSVSPTPDPNATPEPSAPVAPPPSPSVPVDANATTKTISVDVSGDGNETVHLKVECGGTIWFDKDVQRLLMKVPVSITGTGTQTVNIYLDNQLTTQTVDFSS